MSPHGFSKYFLEEPLPLLIEDVLRNRPLLYRRYPLRASAPWRVSRCRLNSFWHSLLFQRTPDTPSASFYRLYEFFVLDWNTQFRNELEYFCRSRHKWAVADIPDPEDPDPKRYAVFAVLTKLMCESFNRRIKLGLPRDAPPIILDFDEQARRPKIYEKPPAWAEKVPPLQERYYIPDINGVFTEEDGRYFSQEFKVMNIYCESPHIHFI